MTPLGAAQPTISARRRASPGSRAHAELAGRLAPPLLEPPEIEGRCRPASRCWRICSACCGAIAPTSRPATTGAAADLLANPLPALGRSLRFLADLGADRPAPPRADRRRATGARRATGRPTPTITCSNFHYQTDGYLSEHSAALYDFQVEVLFNGGADAMRRQALVPIAEHLRGRRIRDQRLLDVACGTGSFLAMVKHNYPRLPVTGLDLSAPYLRHARRASSPAGRGSSLIEGAAEALPFADRSFQPGDLRLSVP